MKPGTLHPADKQGAGWTIFDDFLQGRDGLGLVWESLAGV
jgi:hypothetical protein